jgi:transaldolase
MNNLQRIAQQGQSIWYDNISRSIITGGGLKRMVDEGLLGVTSNPSIFEKAITGSPDYDDQIRQLVEANPEIGAAAIIHAIMIRDIQMACDVLRPVYDRTGGKDGFVSVEVTPSKARDTEGTILEVRELWDAIARPNLMVKIPGTKEGLPAIEQMICEGKNINVTLIFSEPRYREIAGAYIAGLERRLAAGKNLHHVASVASVFVSRIDTIVDGLLQQQVSNLSDAAEKSARSALLGKAAVANTKLIYQAFKEIFAGSRFSALRAKGASVQRPLWGSTSTKNPAYHDLLYVDPLIGPDTVNTVPPPTYTAILDHGNSASSIESGLAEAKQVLKEIGRSGIDMSRVLVKLEEDGVAAFSTSFDGLYRNIEKKKAEIAATLKR